jgi:hypothetical protein
VAQTQIAFAFLKKTFVPLDDRLGCLWDTVSKLSCGALHRCLERHAVFWRPVEETNMQRK